MSSEINALQKFFSFLYQNDMTAEDVVAEADTNEDGYLTKGEFKNFIKDANINITNDEVSQIFKSLDTKTNGKISGTRLNNRNALDSNEMDKMQEKLDAYTEIKQALDEVFASGYGYISIPTELKQYVSIASVEASVLASLNKNFEVRGDLEDILNSAIAKTAANGYGQAQFTKILNNLKTQNKVPASYNGDDEFQSLLSAYIKTLGAETDLESIMSDVDKIIIAYFASAAIFINNPQGSNSAALGGNAALPNAQSPNVSNRGNGYASTPFVWDDEYGLNSLQLAVLADQIIKTSGYKDDIYNKFKSEFDAAIQGFISDTCSGMTFSEIVARHLNDFKDSKYGKALEVLITLSDFSEPKYGTSPLNNAFYNALEDAFGEEFANTLAMADVDYIAENGVYNTVLKTVYQMIMSGEIENNDTAIVNKMIELIINNYAEFKDGLGVGSSDSPIEDLYNNVQVLADNGALAAVRTAAIAYLDAVWALGNEKLNTFIKTQFSGMDYKTAINKLVSKTVIDSKIDKINDKYKSMVNSGEIVLKVEPSSYTAKWHNVTVPTFRVGGSPQSFSCTATITKDPNDPLEPPLESSTTNQITYGIVSVVSDTGSTATINAGTGEITFTPGTTDGPAIIKVKVMVNGVEVGTKEITINVKKSMNDVNFAEGDESWCLEVWGTNGTENNTQITDYDFSLLYNNNAAISLIYDDIVNCNLSLLKERLSLLGELVVNALSKTGYKKGILEQATGNIVEAWSHFPPSASVSSQHACLAGAEYLQQNQNYQGVVQYAWEESTGICKSALMVSFRAFVDAIIEEYSRLGGK